MPLKLRHLFDVEPALQSCVEKRAHAATASDARAFIDHPIEEPNMYIFLYISIYIILFIYTSSIMIRIDHMTILTI